MTFDLLLFSSKLKKYRDQRQASIDEVSSETGILQQDLADLENAEKRPAGDEILILVGHLP